MMQLPTNAETILNSALAQIAIANKADLSGLTQVVELIGSLATIPALPRALQTQSVRTGLLVEQIIMGDSEFTSGLEKVSQSLQRMIASLSTFAHEDDAPRSARNQIQAAAQPPGVPSNQKQSSDQRTLEATENTALVVGFSSQLANALEDFESYIMELEKGDHSARDAIKRQLHTWKGEFGVLGLSDYSAMIHEVEEAIEQGSFGIDNYFRLKDLLSMRNLHFAAGHLVPLLAAEHASLFAGTTLNTVQTDGVVVDVALTEAVGLQQGSAGELFKQLNLADCDPTLISDFIMESRDHIHTAESMLLELETDPSNAESINSTFRACHTIKGVAGFLNLSEISRLSHSMENIMDNARKGEVALSSAHIDVLLEAMDCLKALVCAVEKVLEGEAYSIPDSYEPILHRLDNPQSVASAEAPPSVRAEQKIGEILIATGAAGKETIDKALALQSEGDTRKLGQILMEEQLVQPRELGRALAGQSLAQKTKTVEDTIRVPVDRLDQLIDAIGEAVIAQSMVSADRLIRESGDQGLERKIAQSNLIMRQIQELSMSLRMVSVRSTFQKMARLVRDLSKKTGKVVNFVMEGEDTELDKTVVENIGDPLIHMVRNSVDHGIESAEERCAAGKPEQGSLTLRAYHKAGNVVIEIEDDGKGLDKEAIWQKALEKGLVRSDAKCSDNDIYNFIFMPGFSTAKQVTDVSGRGVGMDVVRRNIQALRGSIEIRTERGKGTVFTIRLPLTLAIINGMVVRIAKERYIIPTLSIVDSLRPTPEQIQSITAKGEMLNVRGDLMQFVRLSKLLGSTKGVVTEFCDGIALVVEDMLGKKIGLFVDEILGQQQVVIKSLGDGLGDVDGVTGGAIMNDGSVSLILDVAELVRMAQE